MNALPLPPRLAGLAVSLTLSCLALPGLALVQQLYLSVAALGHARSGTQALELALAAMNGIDWKGRPVG